MDDRKNADRFKGFPKVYDSARPKCPEFVVTFLTNYLGRPVDTVVDIGCGTGLSTLIWSGHAQNVIGIEPSGDMLAIALSNAKNNPAFRFISAYADNSTLSPASADIVTCSQCFHWMYPETALPEIERILKPGGIFAAYDCDWPAACGWPVEQAYDHLFKEVARMEDHSPELKGSFKRWNKDSHLKNIRQSGLFRYSREIVFHNIELCAAERYKNLAFSQGGLQAVLRSGTTDINPYIKDFEQAVDAYFKGQTKEILFCYRMRIGIK